VAIAKALAGALDYAHARGRVHRDVKPSNVLLASDLVTPKLTDFGIAVIDQPEAAQLTQHGQMLGTPRYMSPEQIRGEPADARSDLFSLGATLYEMLTGEFAFPAESLVALSSQITQDQPAPVRRLAPETPPQVAAAVAKLLEKDPARRFQSGRELLAALEAAPDQRRRSKSPRERRRVPIGAMLAGLGALALGGGLAALYFWPAPTNWPPVASDDRVLSQSGEAVTIDVLANDSDPDGEPLRVTSAEVLNNGPGRASVVDNKVRYEPDNASAGESAQVTVGYRISDGSGANADAKIEIQLVGTGAAPTATANQPQLSGPGGDALLTLVQEAAHLPCSRIEVEDGADGPHLVGYVGPDADQAALVARARALLGEVAIDIAAWGGPLPMCPFLNLLGDKTLPHVPRLIRLVPPVDGACKAGTGCYQDLAEHRLSEGERLVLQIDTPDFESYSTVDYFTADRQVAHLMPAPDLQSQMVPAAGYRNPQPAGSTFFIGDQRADHRIIYSVDGPFGREMILSLAAKRPLFAAARPAVEPAEAYLADLRRALDASSDQRPVASVLVLETVGPSP
jgi:hypothetical protein